MWTIIGVITFLVIAGLLGFLYIRDRRYEKKLPSETMSKEMWDEIAGEKEENLAKAKRFKEALEKARRRP